MSNEEKKAIDKLKRSANYFVMPIYETKIILKLIEKQQKELEKLKENNGYHIGFIDGGIAKRYEYEDKIKAKIEEYDDKEMTKNLVNRSAGKTFQQAVHYEVKIVLQSLLEKE